MPLTQKPTKHRKDMHPALLLPRWAKRAGLSAVLSLGWLAMPAALRAQAEPNTMMCTLTRSSAEFSGICEVPCLVNALAVDIDGPNPRVTCNAAPRKVSATLKQSQTGDNWLGAMQGKFPEDPTRFEVKKGRDGAAGVAKTPYGWFAIRSASVEGDAMTLTISANRQLPPDADDIKIITRARELVAGAPTWNRKDTRQCPPGAQSWSVFCALMQATEEISGGIHYRQPALQAVREAVNEVGGTHIDKHRLMDYNNHPDTTLDDIHGLLALARGKLEKRFR